MTDGIQEREPEPPESAQPKAAAPQADTAKPAAPEPNSYRSLDVDRVLATLVVLRKRIGERFPDSGLERICDELVQHGEHARERAAEIGRPLVWLRVLSTVLVGSIILASIGVFGVVQMPKDSIDAAELIGIVEAGINDLVLVGAAIFFLLTLETRIKRRRALAALHELRSAAHIIDMHQLTKDPERLLHRGPDTESSPRDPMPAFELTRYLDYCSEMLSLTGKLAALYVERFDDSVTLSSANDLENLCGGLSRKIWQKIMIVQTLSAATSGASKSP